MTQQQSKGLWLNLRIWAFDDLSIAEPGGWMGDGCAFVAILVADHRNPWTFSRHTSSAYPDHPHRCGNVANIVNRGTDLSL
ncbi:hypothetical protein [Actinoplanes subtropicus]|uniref:hypothetical protein n=1 Tax=Actinoplanes subtropicus TaxID=543632 RepID=UPI0012FB1DEA|nr:hypothetical protein [Actinoplanes subtropicus]